MGVQLADLVAPKKISFEELSGKIIAIDAMNSLYQFLSIIRQPTGEPLMDSHGRITSHLSGLFYRTVNLVEYGIKPVYVYDGKPPEIKEKVVKQRERIREEAREKWQEALTKGKLEEARIYAQQASFFTQEMIRDSKTLLAYLGIPFIEAPQEGEAQASYLVQKGDAYATGSQDYDSLLFGSTRLVRNLTISGRRKLPRKNVYVEIEPEIISLKEVLEELGITREQLIDIAILIGTDYNPGGVEGIGPKKAYTLIKKYGDAKEALKAKGITPNFDIDYIRELFINFEKTEDYEIKWEYPDEEKIIEFLCKERDFSIDRVKKALERIKKKMKKVKTQASLDSWFG